VTVNIYTVPLLISWRALICVLLIIYGDFLQMLFGQLRRSRVDVWKARGESHVLGDFRTTYTARKFVWSRECRALNDEVLTRRARPSYCSGMTGTVLGLALVATAAASAALRASS
jgi:hypothetical protein